MKQVRKRIKTAAGTSRSGSFFAGGGTTCISIPIT